MKPGRKPLTLTCAQRAELLAEVAAGASLPDAARRIGTCDRTLYRLGRRDDAFRVALDAAIAEREANRERVGHGTLTRYQSGCHCDLCRGANTQHARIRLRQRRQQPIPAHIPHGRSSTYNNWGCRCEPCTKAHTEYCRPYVRAWQQRQRERAS